VPEQRSGAKPLRFGSKLVACVIVVLAAGVGIDAWFVVSGFRESLDAALTNFRDARERLLAMEPAAADVELASAQSAADAAQPLLRHPAYTLMTAVPWLREEANAIAAMQRSADLAVEAGRELVAASRATGRFSEGSLPGLYRDGRVRFDSIRRIHDHITRATALLLSAEAKLEAAQQRPLTLIEGVLRTSLEELSRARRSAAKAVHFLEVLPAIFAEGSKRTYLLGFESLGEARGTGGLLGHYGVMRVRDGHLRLKRVGSIDQLADRTGRPIETPRWFRRHHGPSAGASWQQANLTADFPLAARIWSALFRQATGVDVDGVFSMDPVSLAFLTRATGPLRAPGIKQQIGPRTAVDVLMDESYELSYSKQTAYHSAVVRAFWQRLVSGEFHPRRLIMGLVASVRTRHMKIFLHRNREQNVMEAMGVSASLSELEPMSQMVFHSNAAANKVDYYLRQRIDTEIRLQADGSARIATNVALANTAPKGPPSYRLGPGIAGDPPGLNRLELNFLLPVGSEVVDFAVDGADRRPFLDHEGRFPLAWDLLDILPGHSKRVSLVYIVPSAWGGAPGGRFSFAVVPQPASTFTQASWSVMPPEGFVLERLATGRIARTFGGGGDLRHELRHTVRVIQS
jgi:hypothetical protein